MTSQWRSAWVASLFVLLSGAFARAQRQETHLRYEDRRCRIEWGAITVAKDALQALQPGAAWVIEPADAPTLTTEMALVAGDAVVPPGAYRMTIARESADRFSIAIERAHDGEPPGMRGPAIVRIKADRSRQSAPTDTLRIALLPDTLSADPMLPCTVRITVGDEVLAAPLLLAGTRSAQAEGWTLDAFTLPVELVQKRIAENRPTPVATLRPASDEKRAARAWNVFLGDGAVEAWPAPGATNDTDRAAESRAAPSRSPIVSGSAAWGQLDLKRPTPPFLELDRFAVSTEGQATIVFSVARRQCTLSLPPPGSADSRPADAPRLLATWEGHTAPVHGLTVSADGRRVMSASDDATLRLWDSASGEQLAVFSEHRDKVWAVAFLPSDRQALSAGWDGTLKVWDVSTARALASFGPTSSGSALASLAVSYDGKKALSGGFDSVVRLWDLESKSELRAWEGHSDTVWAVAFSRDGRTAFSGSFDGTVRTWDVGSGRPIATWKEEREDERSWKRAIAMTADGSAALVGGAASPRLWDVATGRPTARFAGGHSDSVVAVAVSADGRQVASGGFDGHIHLWDMESRQTLVRWNAGQGPGVWAVAFLPAGRLVSAGDTGTVKLWDARR
jgi:WD40 repeat protein